MSILEERSSDQQKVNSICIPDHAIDGGGESLPVGDEDVEDEDVEEAANKTSERV